MKKSIVPIVAIACVLAAGCKSRSISNSGYQPRGTYIGQSDEAFRYHGELSEFDVLGIERGDMASDYGIAEALDKARAVKLRPDSSVLLIQSGAMFPDGPMVSALEKHFRVTPFSGIPPMVRKDGAATVTKENDPQSFAQSLRLAAARGGNDAIICYWGVLESATENLATKTVSWVPVMNWIVPDERQHMRIQLKLAVVDVRTGNWSVISTQPLDNTRISRSPKRGVADQAQVELLKSKAYEAAANDLVKRYLAIVDR